MLDIYSGLRRKDRQFDYEANRIIQNTASIIFDALEFNLNSNESRETVETLTKNTNKLIDHQIFNVLLEDSLIYRKEWILLAQCALTRGNIQGKCHFQSFLNILEFPF